MSNYNSLKATIDANIKQNGRQEITGQILNSVLNQMVTTLGTGYQFAGVATIATNPGTPDAKVFYIANGKGTYEKFGGLEVTEDEVVVLYYDTAWHKVATGIASHEKLTELEQELGEKTGDFSAIPMFENVTIASASGNYAPSPGAKAFIYPLSGSGKVSFVSISGVSHNVKLLPSNVVVIGQSANVISNVSPSGTTYDETCKYLYVQTYQTGTDRTPAAIYVNGYDILKGVLDNTKSLYQELQKEGSITAVKIADSAVTSAKIADSAVTSAKIADSAVTSAKIENEGVIWEKRTKAGVFGLLVNSYNLVPIQFDTINRTITIPKYTRLICGRKQIPLSRFTEDYTIDISGYANGILAVNGNFNSIKADSIFVASHMSAASLADLLASENYILVCGWGNFGVSCVNSPSAFSVDGKPYGIDTIVSDANIKNVISEIFPVINPVFDLITLPSGITWWSDFIHIKINGEDEMWFFTPSAEDHTKMNGKCHRIKMSDWSYIGNFTHNFGHCNTCHYDAKNDVLLISNLPGHEAHPSALYLFYNVSSWASMQSVDFNSISPSIIDLTPLGYSGTNAAVFGENGFDRRNIVYVMSGYGTPVKFHKIVLGMGQNQLTYGTYDANHASDTQYNGTYDVLLGPLSYVQQDGAGQGKQVIQGGDFANGKIITANGHNEILGFIYNIFGDKIQRTMIENVPRKADGTIDHSVGEGICVKDGFVYHGYIKTSADFNDSYSVEGFYLAKYRLP